MFEFRFNINRAESIVSGVTMTSLAVEANFPVCCHHRSSTDSWLAVANLPLLVAVEYCWRCNSALGAIGRFREERALHACRQRRNDCID